MRKIILQTGMIYAVLLLAFSISWAWTDIKVNQDIGTTVQNEPSIVINRHYIADPLNIVVAYNDIGNPLGVSWSADSGRTWTDVNLPQVYALATGDPSVAADNFGNVYACFLSYDGTWFYGKSGIFVCKSTDGGRSWGLPVPADTLIYHSGPPVPFADKCMMTVDTNSSSPYVNNIYVAWQRDNTDGLHSDIYFARSTNGGTSFSTPLKINDNALGTSFSEGGFPFVGADGSVYVGWYDSYFRGHEPGSLYVDKSVNGGVSFGTDKKVTDILMPPLYTHSNTNFKAKSFISAAADPNNPNYLYMTYISDPDGYFDKRLDNGKAPGVPVGSPPSNMPVIDRENNYVYVAWQDSRNGGGTDLYFNRSSDNGQSWSLPDKGPLDNGDTPGANNSWKQKLSSSGNFVYCVWEDYRYGNTNIFFNYSTNNGSTWQTDKQVDGGVAAGVAHSPTIASTGNYVYVAWADFRSGWSDDIYFAYSSNNGASWSAPVRVDNGDAPGANASFNPRLACVGNYVYCMWADMRASGTSQAYFNYSTNNGVTWQPTSIKLSSGTTSWCSFPLYGGLECTGSYVYTYWQEDRYVSGQDQIFFNRSINNGATWGGDVLVNDSGFYCSMPDMEIIGNYVYLAWQDNRISGALGLDDIFFDYSSDNGGTWRSPDIGPLDPMGIPLNAYAVNLACEGSYVYATWNAGAVFCNVSSNNGAAWGTDFMVNFGTPPAALQNNLPVISAANGFVNVVWADPRVFGWPNIYTNYSSNNGVNWLSGMDEADIFCVRSIDGGLTWQTPVTVNDDATTYPQVLPWVAVKSNGLVDISYYNFRFTPINPIFHGAEVRLAVSGDSGQTFQPTIAIQDTVTNPMELWAGEYNGMAVIDSFVYTVFTDFLQTGNSDIFIDRTVNPSIGTVLCGDANADKTVNVADAVWIINYVFAGGLPPNPLKAGDTNCDGTCNVADAVWIINYVFAGGNQPCDTDGDGVLDC